MSRSAPRYSGILLHPTSLPGAHGSGDLGASAYHFVDWLATARQSLWQMLPLGGLGPGNSPYMSPSAFAGNELLIGLSTLRDAGWLTDADVIADPAFSEMRVDYPAVFAFRMSRLRLAATRFFASGGTAERADFDEFCRRAASWLDDYALFMAIDRAHGGDGKLWPDWPRPLAQREPKALRTAAKTLGAECAFWKFAQWCFDRQWQALKRYANARGVDLVGDIPIFVSAHSADVWANPGLFLLDEDGRPRVVAGVPPDYFSATGQRWGNPLYDWPAHRADGYRWWIARLEAMLTRCDIVRIDHFRGFESYWEIPAAAETAVDGHWRPGPGLAFFEALGKALPKGKDDGRMRIIAEDLGTITPEVLALRRAVGLPGMRVLQFAFDGDPDNFYLPHNYESSTVVYTGTHDNNTTIGWWSEIDQTSRAYIGRYLGASGESIHWDFIRAAFASVADYAIVPMQDILGLDAAHRMNLPGTEEGNWAWRFSWAQVASWHAERLADMTRIYGRQRHPERP